MKNLYVKSLFIFLILFVSGAAIGQEKINQLDAKGRRTGIWKKYYDNKNIRYEGQFEAGKEKGVFNYYGELNPKHPNIMITFSEASDIAQVIYFYDNGIMQSEGSMKGINRIGKWLYYNTDGKTIVSEENYENGLLNGTSVTFFASGKITEMLNFKNGKLHGNVLRYSSEGVLLDDLQYENDKLNGLAKYYDVDGKLLREGLYENDEKVGNWEYFENGEPITPTKIKE